MPFWRVGLALLSVAWLAWLPLVGQAGVEPLPPPRSLTADLARYPNLKRYDLGTLNLTQPGVAPPWQIMPLPLTGVIGLPAGGGSGAWVVILHGRHGGCHFADGGKSQWPCSAGEEIPYDQGFAYLAQALTEAGYGVLIPNLNGAFSDTYGATPQTLNPLADQRSQALVDAHLGQLAMANQGQSTGFGVDLTGRVDWSRLAMVGHSMGGGAAALSALQRQGQTSAAERQAGQGPIAALVLVSPTRSYPLQRHPEVYHLADSPTVVLLGGCDRDIVDLSSFYYFETARQDPHRQTLAAAVWLLGANHNFFNAAVDQDDYYRQPDNSALCNPQRSPQRLSRVAQENFLIQYVRAFLDAWLGATPRAENLGQLGLDPNRPAPSRVFDQPVLTNLAVPPRQRYIVFDAQTADSSSIPAITNLGLERCQPFTPCGSEPRPQPQFPAILKIYGQAPAVSLPLPMAQPDMSRFRSLQIRLAVAADDAASDLGLAVVLHDRRGQAVRVDIPATTPALYQFAPATGAMAGKTPVYPTALRVPLAQFHGIDLTALTAVELTWNGSKGSNVDLASVEFVGYP